jgi:hypothetical protein
MVRVATESLAADLDDPRWRDSPVAARLAAQLARRVHSA